MPEIETPQTTTETPVEQTPTLQDQNRQALYEQYYGTAGGNQPVQDAAPVTESTAHVEQPPAPTTSSAALPPEVVELIRNGSTQLAAVQAELAALKAQVAAPAAAPAAEAVAAEPSWVALLREGKIKEAEDAFAAVVAQKNEAALIEQLTEKIGNQTRDRMRAESEIERFTTDLRAQNPDLVPFEKWIAVEAQDRMAAYRNQGLIKNTDDAVRYYKQSVTEAVSTARKAYQSIRGDGKTEGQTRNREVLSSRPIPPQQVDVSRQQITGDTQEPPTESTSEYLQKREAVAAWKKGLAPKPNFI